MYVKYMTNFNTRTCGVIRDVTRIITTGSIANLEFQDPGMPSTIEGSTSNLWTLDSRDSLSTDATPGANDVKYRLYQNTAAAGIKKGMGVILNSSYTLNSTVGYQAIFSSASQAGFTLTPLMSYEGVNELESFGYSGVNGAYAAASFKYSSTGLHIFTGQKYCVIVGREGMSNGVLIQGFVEVDKTSMHSRWEAATGRTSPSVIFFQVTSRAADAFYTRSIRSTADIYTSNCIQFPEMAYSSRTGKPLKSLVFTTHGDPKTTAGAAALADDGTSTGTANGLSTTQDFPGLFPHISLNVAWHGSDMLNWMSQTQRVYTGISTNQQTAHPNNFYEDENGTKKLPLYPLLASLDSMMSGTVINISKYCPIYMSSVNIGQFGDTLTIGSDKYIYIGAGVGEPGVLNSFFMKVE